jgi:polar amino acid transport system permease protein
MSDNLLQYWRYFLDGALTTIWISWLGLLLGAVIGSGLALMRVSRSRLLRAIGIVYVETFRSLPILVLLFFCYYGLALVFNVDLSPFVAATVALTLSASAMMTEVIRAGIESVPRGQWEASRAAGMTARQRWQYVILPQAIRVIVPPSVGVYIMVLKDSSLAAIIGYVELTKAGLLVRDATGENLQVLAIVAVLYFIINYSISLVGTMLERKFHIA